MSELDEKAFAAAMIASAKTQDDYYTLGPKIDAAIRAYLAAVPAPTVSEEKWEAIDEVGNDNFATSIYEAGHKGLLVARCNQNGNYPWQATAIIRGLTQNKGAFPAPTVSGDAKEIVDRLRSASGDARRLCLDAAMMIEYLAGKKP